LSPSICAVLDRLRARLPGFGGCGGVGCG